MYLPPRWSGRPLRSVVTMVLGGTLGIAALARDLHDPVGFAWDRSTEWVGATAWTLLLVWTVVILVGGHFRAARWREASVPLVLLVSTLVGVLQAAPSREFPWLLLIFLVAFVITIRAMTPLSPMVVAVASIAVVLAAVALEMVDAERREPAATITTVDRALMWAGTSVFRLYTLVELEPLTARGKFLGAGAIMIGILLMGAVFSAVTAWIIRTGPRSSQGRQGSSMEEAMRRVLIEAGVLPEVTTAPSEPRLIIDVDRVVGSQPKTWGVSRGRAIVRYLHTLSRDETARERILSGDRVPALLVSRGTGAWAQGGGPESDLVPGIEIVLTQDSPSEWIARHAGPEDRVVTDGQDGRLAVEESGAQLMSLHRFLRGEIPERG